MDDVQAEGGIITRDFIAIKAFWYETSVLWYSQPR